MEPSICNSTVSIFLDDDGSATYDVFATGPYPDNCGEVNVFTFGIPQYDCEDVDPQTLALGYYDGTNFEQCSMTIIVVDDMAPIANCKPTIVSLDENGLVTVPLNLVNDGSTDNCEIVDYALAPVNFDCSHAGTTQVVTLTVTDAAGLTSSCTSDVMVVDEGVNPPSYCGDTFIIDIDPITSEAVFDLALLPEVFDNCTGALFVFTDGTNPTFNCTDLGENNVVLNYADQNFTFGDCKIIIEVTDSSDACGVAPMIGNNNTDVISTELITGEEETQSEEGIENIQLTENEAEPSLSRVHVYPNPFAARTTVEYYLASPAHTEITVWDATGRQLEQLLSGVMSSGKHRTTWTPRNLPQGLYLIRIQVENELAKVVRVNYN